MLLFNYLLSNIFLKWEKNCSASWGSVTRTFLWRSLLGVSVIQVLFLPRGGGDRAVGVHDDLCTADDHGYQQQAEEGNAGKSQALVHIHESWLHCALHLHDCCWLLSSDTLPHPGTILKSWLQIHSGSKKIYVLSHNGEKEIPENRDYSNYFFFF